MRLFAVPRTAPLFEVLSGGVVIKPAHAVTLLGKAVHVSSAARAMRTAVGRLPFQPSPSRQLRYASACSGVDMLGVALQHVAPWAWEYVFACEASERASRVLLAAHQQYGLSPSTIYQDACSPVATAGPYVDIWSITPPCESFSRRNHCRSNEGDLESLSELVVMLGYARCRRPAVIVVENVDEQAAVAGISAALLSVQGYAWEEFVSDARDYGPMARTRHFWVGARS